MKMEHEDMWNATPPEHRIEACAYVGMATGVLGMALHADESIIDSITHEMAKDSDLDLGRLMGVLVHVSQEAAKFAGASRNLYEQYLADTAELSAEKLAEAEIEIKVESD